MELYGNILVLGDAGVGKSTLINSIIGEKRAATGFGTEGTSSELKIYASKEIPFRLIDSVGFVPSPVKRAKTVASVQKWCKDGVNKGGERTINVVWFCIDGTRSKLFPETIKSLISAVKMWDSVPIIVVITKAYSEMERSLNRDMVLKAFEIQKKKVNLKEIIPVVAEPYVINEDTIVQASGLEELIEKTNQYIPNGIKAAEDSIKKYNLGRKRAMAHGLVGTCTAGAVAIGAVPIPYPDGIFLTSLESVMFVGIRKIYKLPDDESFQQIKIAVIEAGTVGIVAKSLLKLLKGIPGLNLPGLMLNGVVAGVIVASLGEATTVIMDQIYRGEREATDIDWIREKLAEAVANEKVQAIIDAVREVFGKMQDPGNVQEAKKLIKAVFKAIQGMSQKSKS